MAFRNYLAYKYGGQEIGRPQDVQAALDESLTIIQQLLGADPHDKTGDRCWPQESAITSDRGTGKKSRHEYRQRVHYAERRRQGKISASYLTQRE